MEQWHGRLTRRAARSPGSGGWATAGRTPRNRATCSSRPVTRPRRTSRYRRARPADCSIADECHGLGGRILRRAMLPQYEERLGLTATLERSDDAVTELLLPYFGGICYRYGFEQAIADGVCAPPRVAFVGVPTVGRRAGRVHRNRAAARRARANTSVRSATCRSNRSATSSPRSRTSPSATPAPTAAPPATTSTRSRSGARSWRRLSGKYELLGDLAPAIKDADGALVFTETVRAANHAINRLDPLVSIDLITGSTARGQRREILDDLRVRKLDAVAAPRVLDEGIDVPDANLGIVMSASRTRRQMIQRMGRILRRKRPGVAARFVIMFAKDTLEDPANRIERDGFLDEIERISEATGRVRRRALRRARRVPRRARPRGRSRTRAARALRARPRPPVVPSDLVDRRDGRGARRRGRCRDRVRVPQLYAPRPVGPATRRRDPRASARGFLSRRPMRLRTSRSSSRRCRRSPSRGSSRSACRPGRRRSRSHASDRRGASAAPAAARASALVQFRWQVLDQTVTCRCT